MPRDFFFIYLRTKRPRWPFSWGPFGGEKVWRLRVRDAYFEIFQREGSGTTRTPVSVECFTASDGSACCTTVDFGTSRLRRRTGVPT
jgi:hypothetical protein